MYKSPQQLLTLEQTLTLNKQQDRFVNITDLKYCTKLKTLEFKEIRLDLDERNIVESLKQRKPRQQMYALSLSKNLHNTDTFFIAFTASTTHNKQRVYRTKLLLLPKHYKDMLKHLYRARFEAALQKEYNNLVRKGTFKVVY